MHVILHTEKFFILAQKHPVLVLGLPTPAAWPFILAQLLVTRKTRPSLVQVWGSSPVDFPQPTSTQK